MNEAELQAYREGFSEKTLRFMAMVHMFELHGLEWFIGQDRPAKLTDLGKELADTLLKEDKYLHYALEKVDSARESSSHVDLLQ